MRSVLDRFPRHKSQHCHLRPELSLPQHAHNWIKCHCRTFACLRSKRICCHSSPSSTKVIRLLCCSPPLTDLCGVLAEITYALGVLKADGITLYTRYGDSNIYLGHPQFSSILQGLNRRASVVFVHPTTSVYADSLLPQPALDYPHETARTALRARETRDMSETSQGTEYRHWHRLFKWERRPLIWFDIFLYLGLIWEF